MNVTISIDQSVASALQAALAAAQVPAGNEPPPTQPPVVTPPAVPQFVNPYPTRSAMQTELPVMKGDRVYSPQALNDNNVWLLGFTIDAYGAQGYANLGGAEWIDQQAFRVMMIVRNSDGVIVYSGAPTVSPGIVAIPGVPTPHSGRTQIEPGVRYTVALIDFQKGVPPSKMFFEGHVH